MQIICGDKIVIPVVKNFRSLLKQQISLKDAAAGSLSRLYTEEQMNNNDMANPLGNLKNSVSTV